MGSLIPTTFYLWSFESAIFHFHLKLLVPSFYPKTREWVQSLVGEWHRTQDVVNVASPLLILHDLTPISDQRLGIMHMYICFRFIGLYSVFDDHTFGVVCYLAISIKTDSIISWFPSNGYSTAHSCFMIDWCKKEVSVPIEKIRLISVYLEKLIYVL